MIQLICSLNGLRFLPRVSQDRLQKDKRWGGKYEPNWRAIGCFLPDIFQPPIPHSPPPNTLRLAVQKIKFRVQLCNPLYINLYGGGNSPIAVVMD